MVWVLKPDFVSYFAYSLVRACQQILDAVDDGEVNVLNGRFARFFFLTSSMRTPKIIRE